MTDRELADSIYRLVGLCGFDALEAGNNYEYVRDGRVCLAMMEKAFVILAAPGKWAEFYAQIAYRIADKNICELGLAINEVCVEALTNESN